jgi:hypothetical protein
VEPPHWLNNEGYFVNELAPLSWSIDTRVYETEKRSNRETGKSVFPAEFKRDALDLVERRETSLYGSKSGRKGNRRLAQIE